MEGYKEATGNRFSRIFFFSFYITTLCLITIMIAFILDTFLFRMQYKRCMDKKTEEKMLRTQVSLSGDEIDFCYKHYTEESRRRQILQDYGEDLAARGCVNYVGWRRRTKEILFKRMFRNEIPDWVRESEHLLQINHDHN
jgi:two pore calcium channel protein 1